MVRKLLSNDTSKSEVLNCCHYDETVKEFGLQLKSVINFAYSLTSLQPNFSTYFYIIYIFIATF